MQTKWFARAGVGVFVAVAITVAVIEVRTAPAAAVGPVNRPASAIGTNPLHRELVRCQSIGVAGASDPSCLRAWAEARQQFLGPVPRGVNPLPGADDDAASVAANVADAQALSSSGGR